MTLLKTALLLNASSCIAFGAMFLLIGNSISTFIGNPLGWLVPAVGAALLFNGLHLVLASRRSKPVCSEILYFVAGDLLWVVGTLVLVCFGVVITSAEGAVVALIIAMMVAVFAAMQVLGFKKVCSGGSA